MTFRAKALWCVVIGLSFGLLFPTAAHGQLDGVAVSPGWFLLSHQQQTHELDQEVAIGSRITRVFVPWAVLQPHGPRTTPHMTRELTFFLAAAHARHIKVILDVSGAPCWAVSGPCQRISPPDPNLTLVGTLQPPNPSLFATYAADLAGTYGSEVYAMEIGNEPNNPTFFKGTVSQYVEMLRESYAAIKRVAPRMIVLGGSVEQANPLWLAAAYIAGMRDAMDALSIHPYSLVAPGRWVTPSSLNLIPDAHTVMLAFGDTRKLWITEFGYSNCPSWFPFCASDSVQGQWLVDSFRQDATWSYVRVAISYKLRDDTRPDGFGLMRRDFTPKAAYRMVKGFLHQAL